MRPGPSLLLPVPAGVLATLVACGGGGSPSGPSGPTGPSEPTHSVRVTVYYDENANGQLDAEEGARVPGVEVVIGSGTGTTAAGTGMATVTGIRAGAQQVSLRTGSLPAFYEPGPEMPVTVPGVDEVLYPVTLPIGNNQRNLYLGLGDSITDGEGSSDGSGYGPTLQNLLGPHFGRAEVRLWGRPGDTSAETAAVARKSVRDTQPAYTLVLLGTNDWTDNFPTGCQDSVALCTTIESLRSILEEVKNFRSLPVLGTLPPVNPAQAPAGRNLWIDEMNQGIRALAQEQGALLVDANGAFKARSDLSQLFVDDVHPNDAGYEVLARAWFDAITRGRAASASRPRRIGFSIAR